VVGARQVSALVGDDGGALAFVEDVQHPGGQHDPAGGATTGVGRPP
jgi:hypothetical protein